MGLSLLDVSKNPNFHRNFRCAAEETRTPTHCYTGS